MDTSAFWSGEGRVRVLVAPIHNGFGFFIAITEPP
jgi:hypothetical protein